MSLHPRDRAGVLAASLAAAIGLALMVSGSSMAPAEGPALATRTRALELGDATESLLVATLEHELGTPQELLVPDAWADLFPAHDGDSRALAERLASGARSYAENCQHCHGVRGDADTQTAKILLPRPRDFSLGFTKYKSTPGNTPPLREDLARVLNQGIGSTAMASFAHLDEAERLDLVDYVQAMMMRSAVETRVAGALNALAAQDASTSPIDATELEFRVLQSTDLAIDAIESEWRNAPALRFDEQPMVADANAVARGEALYRSAKAGCVQCHGQDGKGRGLGAWDPDFGWILRDVWGDPIRPADFTYGSFHGGSTAEEIYRSLALGVAGTPMAGYAGVLEPQELSDLTHYLLSLSR
jgi:mono/diheme cytochrome c family protein